jgi:hypothetical protein
LQGTEDAFIAKLDAGGRTLVYSTYLGGSKGQIVGQVDTGGNSIAVDSNGNAYITGGTNTSDFPTVGAYQSALPSVPDPWTAFVTKLNASGDALLYSTYLGGGNGDDGAGIALGPDGGVYVSGTAGTNFPTTAGAYQTTTTEGAYGAAFIAKIDTAKTGSSSLIYSTYLGGGTGNLQGPGIAVDSSGDAIVAGTTTSANFPMLNAWDSSRGLSSDDGFLTKLNPAGTALLYSTYVGGGNGANHVYSDTTIYGVALDPAGDAYVTGTTDATDFPQNHSLEGSCYPLCYNQGFVAKFGPGGGNIYSTLFGGTSFQGASTYGTIIYGIAADSSGNAYVTGTTSEDDFPLASPIQSTLGGGPTAIAAQNAFVAELYPGGGLAFSTYLGGSTPLLYPGSTTVDQGSGIAVDGSGNIYVTGPTQSVDFPVTPGAFQTTMGQNGAAFVTKIGAGNTPFLVVTPPSTTFGRQALNTTSSPLTVLVHNLSSGSLAVTNIVFGGTDENDFKETDTCGVAVAGGSDCSIAVTFTPSQMGAETAIMTVTATGAAGSPTTVALNGTGASDGIPSVPAASANLGPVVSGAGLPEVITLTNTGTGPLGDIGIAVSGGFTLVSNNCPATLAVGASCTFSVAVAPGGTGAVTGQIAITSDAVQNSRTIGLAASMAATWGQLTYAFTTISFPGSKATMALGLTDAGEVVGTYQDSAGAYHGFTDIGGTFATLDAPSSASTQASGVNDSNKVVGAYSDAKGAVHGFSETSGTFTTLDVPGAASTMAMGVASTGEIVGGYTLSSGAGPTAHGFDLCNGCTAYSTYDFPGYSQTQLYGIGGSGIVGVHSSATLGTSDRGLLWNAGTFSELNYPGAAQTDATGITPGAIVGYYQDVGGNYHGFLSDGASFFSPMDFPGATETKVFGINSAWQLVGSYVGPSCPSAGGCGFLAKWIPYPLINQPLAPAAVAPGGAQFTLTVNGTGFVSSSVADWNGSPLATTFVTGGQLTATVPAASISAAGTAAITVVNPEVGASNLVFLPIANPASGLLFADAGGSPISVGTSAQSVAVGDFNNDGILDLAVANMRGHSVVVMLGQGGGAFSAGKSFAMGSNSYPMALAVGDFNGDGNPDLAVVDENNADVVMLLGDGTGSFSRVSSTPGVSSGPSFVAAGDFNADGDLDLAVGGSNGVTILLGNGDGTFYSQISLSAGTSPRAAAVGDFNGDGNLDLAVANGTSPSTVTILLGDGTGNFTQKSAPVAGSYPGSVEAADLNGDGKLDLAVANAGDSTVTILLGKGDGTFNPVATAFPTGSYPAALAVGDFNADGKLDLAVVNEIDNTVSILLGDGAGNFATALTRATGSSPDSLAVGSFNAGDKLDLAVANQAGSVSVLLQTPGLNSISIAPLTVPAGVLNQAYSQTTFTATGGSGTLTMSENGSIPGITFTVSGSTVAMSGTPTTASPAGGYAFTMTATDSAGNSVSRNYSLTVAAKTALTYLVGDVAPYTSDWAPNFGDKVLDIQDLIQELFAVNSIPGFTPAACSDRFDAMDLYPVDTATTRGGDGALDIRDLILELFRVNNLDMARPNRVCMGGALPWAACKGGSGGSGENSISRTAVTRSSLASPRIQAAVQGSLVMGHPQPYGAAERVPVYLEAQQDLVRVAVTFGLGDQQSQLRFDPTAETPPSLAHDSQLGVVAVAWLNGLSVRAGERLLLGYVEAPAGALANLKVYGVSASRLDDNREVRLDASAGNR